MCISRAYVIDVHLLGVYLLRRTSLTGVHLLSVYLLGVHLSSPAVLTPRVVRGRYPGRHPIRGLSEPCGGLAPKL
jgi:hypothetical protein